MGRARWLLGLLLALPACDATLCATDRLEPPDRAVAWSVRFNDLPAFEPPPDIPGEEPFFDPPGTTTYASYTLYDDVGAAVAERWLDGLTRWDGATGTVSAAARTASVSAPGRLAVLLADGRRPSVTFSLADGSVGAEIPAHGAPPEVGGQLVDLVYISERLQIASRRRTRDGGGDLLLVDPTSQLAERTLDLARVSTGPVEPGRIAPLSDDRYLVGLTLVEEPERGAVALVDLSTETVARLEMQGLRDCWEVASMPADPAAPEEARAAVLCRGDLGSPAERREGVGFAIVSAAPDESPTIALTRIGDPALLRNPPTGRVVPLNGGWVAVRSAGDVAMGRDDVLLAIDLEGEDVRALTQDRYSDRWGDALGAGDYSGDELWWPSVSFGVLRWRVEGTGSAATFTPLDAAMAPACEATPPRDIRYLPAP